MYVDAMNDLSSTRELLSRQLEEAIATDPVGALPVINAIQQETAAQLKEAVLAASATSSWAQIGEALGISKQGAHQRFKDLADTATAEIKAEHRAMKQAKRRGDKAEASRAKARRDRLAAELQQAGRELR